MPSIELLFREGRIGTLTLPNRIAMAPMTRRFATPDGVPTDAMVEYYRRRAAGGVGLIITEGTAIAHPAAGPEATVPRLENGAQVAGWRRVTDAVHRAGGRIAVQLWHVGARRIRTTSAYPQQANFAPSQAEYLDGFGKPYELPHPMTEADIAATIATYEASARLAVEAGFDALEIHGAHGYLIDQFLWSGTNKREDRWGGSVENRTRFAVEATRACRVGAGSGFPILFRFSQWKIGQYDTQIADGPATLGAVLGPIAAAGVDCFHASQRDHMEPAFDGSPLNLAAWAKKLTGLPSMSVGKVLLTTEMYETYRGIEAEQRPVDGLLEQMERDEFDFIAIGRALIGDPELPNKMRRGALADIVPFRKEMLASLA